MSFGGIGHFLKRHGKRLTCLFGRCHGASFLRSLALRESLESKRSTTRAIAFFGAKLSTSLLDARRESKIIFSIEGRMSRTLGQDQPRENNVVLERTVRGDSRLRD